MSPPSFPSLRPVVRHPSRRRAPAPSGARRGAGSVDVESLRGRYNGVHERGVRGHHGRAVQILVARRRRRVGDGFFRVAAATPKIRVADIAGNAAAIWSASTTPLARGWARSFCPNSASRATPAATCFTIGRSSRLARSRSWACSRTPTTYPCSSPWAFPSPRAARCATAWRPAAPASSWVSPSSRTSRGWRVLREALVRPLVRQLRAAVVRQRVRSLRLPYGLPLLRSRHAGRGHRRRGLRGPVGPRASVRCHDDPAGRHGDLERQRLERDRRQSPPFGAIWCGVSPPGCSAPMRTPTQGRAN